MSPARLRRFAAPLALIVGIALAGGAQAASAATATSHVKAQPTTEYYLALGDSLSQGVQPDSTGTDQETNQGYADDLYSQLAPIDAAQGVDLQLVKLGCPGETTTSMIDGGVCTTYTSGNQLDDAAAFLAANAGAVQLVTLDIGANDVDGCANLQTGTIDEACVEQGLTDVGNNLPTIVGTLKAADPGVQIVAMNYYDPFVVAYAQGLPKLAHQSVKLANLLNNHILAPVYKAFHVRVANVSKAFQTNDWQKSNGVQPNNVVAMCDLTYMCAPAPVGPNIHANGVGYSVITGAFDPVTQGL